MRVLSGTLRFWSDDEDPTDDRLTEVQLDRVEFVYFDTWEPSLIVEEWYVAEVAGYRVRYGEYDGMYRGLTLKVEGAEHAQLMGWGEHTAAGGWIERPDFVDSYVF